VFRSALLLGPDYIPVKDREVFFEKCQRSFEVGQQLNRKRH
jgi:hypothetical protein